MQLYNFVSFSGIFILLAIAWLFSNNKKIINWRLLFWGIGLQLLFAFFIFVFPIGTKLFIFINNVVVKIITCAAEGSKFVFGRLALSPGEVNSLGEKSFGFILAFQGLPAIIFFSALMSLLYYFNIIPRIIKGFAYIFTQLMKISGAESLSTASNIFVGVESALTIKPYLKDMTQSELCTLLTAGMATVASNVLAVYIFSLQNIFPTIAGHLISASILSAPAALVLSKMIMPETEKPKTLGLAIELHYEKENNLMEAVINGANSGVKLILGIVALLIAVLGLVALLDLFLIKLGGCLNSLLHSNIDWSLKGLLSYLFYPLTLIIGVPPADAGIAARIIGERVVVTELTAYQDLAGVMSRQMLQHPRSAVIITYALCGFAHIASLAIFIGGISALIPQRVKDLTKVGFRALLAATLACLMTACVAGTFFMNNSILLGK